MAQRFNPFQQRAPQNVADLISGLLGDTQQGLVRGQQIRQTREGEQRTQGLEQQERAFEREKFDFKKVMDETEAQLLREKFEADRDKPEKPATSLEGTLAFSMQKKLQSGEVSDEDILNMIMKMKGLPKPEKPAKPEFTKSEERQRGQIFQKSQIGGLGNRMIQELSQQPGFDEAITNRHTHERNIPTTTQGILSLGRELDFTSPQLQARADSSAAFQSLPLNELFAGSQGQPFELFPGQARKRDKAIEFANRDKPDWRNLPPDEQEAYLKFIEDNKL